MKYIFKIFTLIFLTILCSAQQPPLEIVWETDIPMGVDKIQHFSLGQYSTENIYSLSYDQKRTVINVYTLDGDLLYDTVGTRVGSQEAAKEQIDYTIVGDIDENGFLDIFMGTNIKASSVNIHRLYMLQRIPEAGLDRYYNRFVWMVKDTGGITSISFDKFDNDTYQDVITSSIDNKVKVYNFHGELLYEFDLGANVWDVKFFKPEILPIESESGTLIEGSDSVNNSLFFAAVHDGLYLFSTNGSIIWMRGDGSTMRKVEIYDINSDGVNEYFGLSEGKIQVYNSLGELLWVYEDDKLKDIAFSNMFGLGKNYVITASDKTLIFLSDSGEVVWKMDLGEKIQSFKQVVYKDSERIFVGTDSHLISYRINDESFRYSQALSNYNFALDAFEMQDFNKSMYHSNISHTLYRSLRDIINESQALDLYLKSKDFNKAFDFLSLSETSLAKGDLEVGSDYSRKAFELFAKYNYLNDENSDDERISKLKIQLSEAMRQVENRDLNNLAQQHYTIAEDSYVSLEYNKALENAKKSFELYVESDDESGANLSKRLISLIVDSQTTTTSTTILITTTTTLKEFKMKKDDIIFYAALLATLLVIASVIIPRIRKK